MKVLVMGTGGVGGYFGALLAGAGHRVTVIARGAHLDALQSGGLRVETVVEEDFVVPVHALSAPEPDITVDLVLFAVKSYDLDDAIARVRPAVGPETTVLTLLNGVDAGARLADAFGPDRVLDGLVYIESYISAPGIITQAGGPRRVAFGNRHAANGARESALLDAFTGAGWQVELAPHILRALWTKFAYLGPSAAVSTVTGLSTAKLCSEDQCGQLVHSMVSEYVAVGNASGAELAPDAAETIMEGIRTSTIRVTSMLRDRLAGKRLESDALVGSVVRHGQALGVPTPVTDTLYCLLTPMSAGGAAQLGPL